MMESNVPFKVNGYTIDKKNRKAFIPNSTKLLESVEKLLAIAKETGTSKAEELKTVEDQLNNLVGKFESLEAIDTTRALLLQDEKIEYLGEEKKQ